LRLPSGPSVNSGTIGQAQKDWNDSPGLKGNAISKKKVKRIQGKRQGGKEAIENTEYKVY